MFRHIASFAIVLMALTTGCKDDAPKRQPVTDPVAPAPNNPPAANPGCTTNCDQNAGGISLFFSFTPPAGVTVANYKVGVYVGQPQAGAAALREIDAVAGVPMTGFEDGKEYTFVVKGLSETGTEVASTGKDSSCPHVQAIARAAAQVNVALCAGAGSPVVNSGAGNTDTGSDSNVQFEVKVVPKQ